MCYVLVFVVSSLVVEFVVFCFSVVMCCVLSSFRVFVMLVCRYFVLYVFVRQLSRFVCRVFVIASVMYFVIDVCSFCL